MTKLPRVFLGTVEVSGYYARLEAGFRALGAPVTRFSRVRHGFSYNRTPVKERFLQYLGDKYRRSDKSQPGFNPLVSRVPAIERRVIEKIIDSHDVFIFGAMHSLTGMLTFEGELDDLEMIKAAGKKIICVFHGSEARPRYLNGIYKRTDPATLGLTDADWHIGLQFTGLCQLATLDSE